MLYFYKNQQELGKNADTVLNKQEEKQEEIVTDDLMSQYDRLFGESDIEKLSKSIVLLECLYDVDDDGQWDERVDGSGIYISKDFFKKEKDRPISEDIEWYDGYILTNAHLAQLKRQTKDGRDFNFCYAEIGEILIGLVVYNQNTHFLDGDRDVAILMFDESKTWFDYIQENKLGFKLKDSMLKDYILCSAENIVGQDVYVLGYPSSGYEYISSDEFIKEWEEDTGRPYPYTGYEGDPVLVSQNLIVSKGIISGLDRNGNYYTTANIDAGNSGGLAVSEVDDSFCLLGIPTWVSTGTYENLGIIQPFEKAISVFKTIGLP